MLPRPDGGRPPYPDHQHPSETFWGHGGVEILRRLADLKRRRSHPFLPGARLRALLPAGGPTLKLTHESLQGRERPGSA